MPKWPAVQLVAACSLFKGGGWELGQADNFFIYICCFSKKNQLPNLNDFCLKDLFNINSTLLSFCQFSMNVIALEIKSQSLVPYSVTCIKPPWGRGAYLISGHKRGEQKWGGGGGTYFK